MRAFEHTQMQTPPKLAWLTALLAAAAVMLAPATAFGAEETAVACDPATQECAPTTTVVVEETTTEDPAAGVGEEPVLGEETPVLGEETPVLEEETLPVTPVVPTPRINPASEEPALALDEAADVPPVTAAPVVVSTPDPAAPAAPTTPDPAATPFVGLATPDLPAAKPDAAPIIPSIPDYAKPLADAVPAAVLAEVAPVAAKKVVATAKKPQFDIGAFIKTPESAGRFLDGLPTTSLAGDSATLGVAKLTVEEVFTATTEWIRPAVAEPRNLLEVLATYLVPGEGGSYTATLAALIQLAFVLVLWGLLRPRPVPGSIAELRSSRAVGYRAVVFRPG
jgi:hypothetical protein